MTKQDLIPNDLWQAGLALGAPAPFHKLSPSDIKTMNRTVRTLPIGPMMLGTKLTSTLLP